MDYKGKMGYDKDPSRTSTGQVVQQGVTDENYYNAHYMYGADNFGQVGNTNSNYPMMAMGMQQNPMAMPGQDDQNTNYYQEYCRLFIANVVLTTQMKELVAEKNELLAKLAKFEQKQHEPVLKSPSIGDNNNDSKKKRERRRACEIDRHYICPITKCQKAYGSEGSLNQHVKNKHPELANDPEFKINNLVKNNNNNNTNNGSKKSADQQKKIK